LISSSAPRSRSRSSFSPEELVAMTRAPAALANWSANTETPPLPCTSTVSPGLMALSTNSARHAVSPAHVSVAASAAE
jgi:hypothetical protein